jgi:hypothetical protein
MLLGIAALVLVAAGCGGSDDSTDTGSTSGGEGSALTKAQFIKQSDAICEEGNEELESEAEDFATENNVDTEDPTTEQQEEVVVEVIAPAIQRQAEGIDALAAPSGEEEEVEAIVAAVESGATEAEEDPGSIIEESDDGGPFAEANKLADAFGLKVCGSE